MDDGGIRAADNSAPLTLGAKAPLRLLKKEEIALGDNAELGEVIGSEHNARATDVVARKTSRERLAIRAARTSRNISGPQINARPGGLNCLPRPIILQNNRPNEGAGRIRVKVVRELTQLREADGRIVVKHADMRTATIKSASDTKVVPACIAKIFT